jgi:hypothetical protein
MNRLQWIFTGCAIVGGALFLIRLAMQLLGLSAEEALDSTDALESTEADASFRALSLLGVTAFLMMFGLGGRAMLESRPGSAPLALGVGLLAGGFSLWLMGWLFKGMKSLQSSGTTDNTKAVGQEGSVYLTIPEKDVGKVQLTLQGRLSVMDARAANGQALATGARVKVVRVVDGNILEVESTS